LLPGEARGWGVTEGVYQKTIPLLPSGARESERMLPRSSGCPSIRHNRREPTKAGAHEEHLQVMRNSSLPPSMIWNFILFIILSLKKNDEKLRFLPSEFLLCPKMELVTLWFVIP
jgi:hypothetical protein